MEKARILKLVESCEYRHKLMNMELSCCELIHIAMGARADIRYKLKLIRELMGICSDDYDNECLVATIEQTEKAIYLMGNHEGPAVFMLTEYWRDTDDGFLQIKNASKCFHTFKQAVAEVTDLENNHDEDAGMWNIITRYDIRNGELKETIDYLVSQKGRVWKYRFHESLPRKLRFWLWFDFPVPYKIGDIVKVDCRPFNDIHYALMISEGGGDTWWLIKDVFDVKPQNKFNVRNICNLNIMFDDISLFYRIETYDGELDGDYRILKDLQKLIRSEPEMAKKIDDFVMDTHYVSAKELHDEFLR